MKIRWKWLLVAAVVVALGLGVLRALKARQAQLGAVQSVSAAKAQTQFELAPSDIAPAQLRELRVGLPLSGAIKATRSAWVKARVAGELQGLLVREGDPVKAGQVLARVDSVEYEARLKQAQRQADAAKAQVDIAQRQQDNNKALVDQGFISKTALDTSLATLASARATHQAALAAVDVARKSLDDTVLRAPLGGVVSQRLVQPGERVGIDARVVEIVDLNLLELEASVSAADAASVRMGQTALLKVEGHVKDITAKVVRINPSTLAGSRSLMVYLSIDRPDGMGLGLRQGLYAEGTLGTGHTRGLAVPLGSLRSDKPSPYVQVVIKSEAGHQVQHKSVVLGVRGEAASAAEAQDLFVIVEGLTPGDAVLSGTVGALREGTAVKLPASPEKK